MPRVSVPTPVVHSEPRVSETTTVQQCLRSLPEIAQSTAATEALQMACLASQTTAASTTLSATTKRRPVKLKAGCAFPESDLRLERQSTSAVTMMISAQRTLVPPMAPVQRRLPRSIVLPVHALHSLAPQRTGRAVPTATASWSI